MQQPQRFEVGEGEAPIAVDDDERVGDVVHDPAQPILAAAQGFRGDLLFDHRGFEVAVGGLELGGPLADARLQLGVQLGKRPFAAHALQHVERTHPHQRQQQDQAAGDLADMGDHRRGVMRRLE